MRSLYLSFFFLALLALTNRSFAQNQYFQFLNSTIVIADSSTAATFVSTPDNYTANFSTFDLQGKIGGTGNYTEKDYLAHAAKGMRNWTVSQAKSIEQSMGTIASFIKDNKLQLQLPDSILIIKTNAQEEFGADGYTRGNAIILNSGSSLVGTGILSHELFHIFSRYNEATRDAIYALFGFKKCNPIDVSKALQQRNISNPDCPVINHYITVNGQDMVLILYSNRDYTGGSVFEEYVAVSLLVIEGKGNNKQPKISNGKPVIIEFQNAMEIFQQVGTNTDYLLHPEEISAEHFTFLITGRKVRQPSYVEQLKKVLQQ
ncbi:MAG: hypothetical protein R2800_12715 [Flavipsychrobacter sp.]